MIVATFTSKLRPLLPLIAFLMLIQYAFASRMLVESSNPPIMSFQYHNGPLLYGRSSINLIWYGKFKPAQRAIISDFVSSLTTASKSESQPCVTTWWATIGQYYTYPNSKKPTSLSISMGKQLIDESYFFGKTLTSKQVESLASKGPQQLNTINVVLTAADVAVEGFCMSRCGTHGSVTTTPHKFPYIWVGNSETQCPGHCAWPFHQPMYGPQGPPLVAPNNDVGMDGMVINLGSLLAGTVTNPYGNGYFQGPNDGPLEAATACPGVYGKGAYPGYPGNLLVDPTTGASYNTNGINNRKYLLPALYNPATSSCSTLV